MTTIDQPVSPGVTQPRRERKGSVLAAWLSSTDHKVIGHMYLITSFGFFLTARPGSRAMHSSARA